VKKTNYRNERVHLAIEMNVGLMLAITPRIGFPQCARAFARTCAR
jgi:hypothetical protein